MNRRTILAASLAASFVTFCAVQDRVTADGARRYAELQRAALNGRRAPVQIDEVLVPAVRRSVRAGALWAGAVLGIGVLITFVAGRRRGDEASGATRDT